MTNEAIRILTLLIQTGITLVVLWVLVSQLKALKKSSGDPEGREDSARKILVFAVISLILVIGLWTIPSRFLQEVSPTTAPVEQGDMSNSPATENPVATATPDPYQESREQNEETKARFQDL